MTVSYPGYELQPGSVVVIGVNCSNECGAEISYAPGDEEPLTLGAELSFRERSTETGSVPDRELVVPSNSCAHITELTVEP